MRKLCFYIALFGVLSCKKEIKIVVADKPARLVVNAVVDPDSLLYFNLSTTQNITNNSPQQYVSNGLIEVFNQDTTVLLAILNHTTNGDYRSLFFKPDPLKTYFFKITALNRIYWVSDSLPDTVKCEVLDTSRLPFFQGKENFFQVKMSLNDNNTLIPNYYGFRIKRFFETYQGADTLFSEEWVPLESIDYVLTENPKTKFSKKNLIFSDENFSSSNMSLRFGAAGLFASGNQKTTKLMIYTSAYSRNAYNYFTSVNEHLFYQNDPFSQPTVLVGNIPGAFGAAVGACTKVNVIHFK